jgi:hypothetical protein
VLRNPGANDIYPRGFRNDVTLAAWMWGNTGEKFFP